MSDIISNQYDLNNSFLELAKDYFELDTISKSKVGMFGYVTNVMSTIASDATFHRNLLFREFFLNTATMSDSIYNWARVLDEKIDFATPAVTNVALRFDVLKLLSLPEKYIYGRDGGYTIFKLNKGQMFNIGSSKFMLPYEVTICCKYAGTVPSVYATYNTSASTTNYDDPNIVNDNLKVMTEGQVVTIFFSLYQMESKTSLTEILTTTDFDNSIFDINFGKNIVSFTVEYYSPLMNVWQQVEMSFGEDWNTYTPTQKGFFTLVDDKTLRIFFSSKPGSFRPIFGSKLKVTYYYTDGEAGNSSYSGRVNMTNTFFDITGYDIFTLSSPSNGTNQLSFLETKKKLIEKIRTRDSYITESDLVSFFEMIRRTKLSANIKTKVVKTRDDVIKRTFSSYFLMRLNSGEVIPTTTVDIEMNFHDLVERGYSIKPGSMIVYDKDISRFRLIGFDELPDPYIYSTENLVFSSPFLLNVDFNEYPKLNVYRNDLSKVIPLTFKQVNVDVGSITVNNFILSRNALVEVDQFTVAFEVLGNSASIEGKKFIICIIDPSSEECVGVVKTTRLGLNTMTFFSHIKTSDSFSPEGRYLIEDSIYSPNDFNTVIPLFPLKSGNYNLSIKVFDESASNINNDTFYEFDNNDRMFSFAEDLSRFVQCPVQIDNTLGKVTLKRVPLVSSVFFYNSNYNRDLNDSLNKLFEGLDASEEMLENNTTLDVKFFNTSGPSKNFLIDTIDISLRLQIKLKVVYTSDLDIQIKRAIVSFIEGVNENIERRFSVSNLISSLERSFPQIMYIQIFTLNSANVQNIAERDFIDKRSVDYIPEYLTVKKLSGTSSDSKQDFVYDITLDYL